MSPSRIAATAAGGLADAVGGERDRALDDVRRPRRRPAAANLSDRAPWAGRNARADDLAALVGDFGDGRRIALDARHVGDVAVLHRHVEVDAQQHALARDIGLVEGAEAFISARRLSNSVRSDQLAHRHRGVDHAVGKAPLVVVPRHHAHERAVHDLGLVHVEDRRVRIVVEVASRRWGRR